MPRRRTRPNNNLPPFVPLIWDILNNRAYIDLPPSAAKALPYFLGKVRTRNYSDPARCETEFRFSYSEAERLGFSRSTFFKIISDLMANGFIDPRDRGGLRGEGRGYSLFVLSERWKQYDADDFRKVNWRTYIPPFGVRRSVRNVNRTGSIYRINAA